MGTRVVPIVPMQETERAEIVRELREEMRIEMAAAKKALREELLMELLMAKKTPRNDDDEATVRTK